MNEQHQSLPEAISHLGKDLGDLFRAELAIFKREATEQLTGLAAAGVWIAGAAVMGLAFLGVFSAFLIMVISLVLQPWLAALVVTVAWGFVAVSLLAAAGIKLKKTLPLQFDKTTNSVKEDVEWIKSGMKSAK